MLINKKEKIKSLIKVIIILFEFTENNIKVILLIIKYNLEILILRTYKEAINDLNYSL